jgi:hypothetical protein
MPPAEPNGRNASPFWTSVPGLLTGLAALITATIGAYAIFHHNVPKATLIAYPTIIQKGQSSTLTWQTTDADAVNIQEIGIVAATGSQVVAPDSSTIYHLTATGQGGSQKATAEISVKAVPDTKPNKVKTTPNDHPPHPSPDMSGEWRGVLQAPSLPLVFHINVGGASTADSPSQNSYGMLANVTANANDVQIDIPSVGASFHGTLQNTRINGSFSQKGTTLPVALARAGGGGAGVNGDWQGALTFPKLPLVLHIDLGGGSTCDSPNQGYYKVPMTVTADGKHFQFTVPTPGMSFDGTIQGSEIKGIFSQSGGNLPLTFIRQ